MVHNFLIGSHSLINISFFVCNAEYLFNLSAFSRQPQQESSKSGKWQICTSCAFANDCNCSFSWYWDASTHRQL